MLVLSRRIGESIIIGKSHTLRLTRIMRYTDGHRVCVIQHDGPGFTSCFGHLDKGSQIRINDDISFTILKIAGDVVSIGISAPPHISIHRNEIQLRIDREAWEKEQGDPMGMRND
ncbi:Carbon storage regulator [uncultured Caudovirales phage]|uniref:Carbon storage regulator n=1 Tax=uncultured Caudovirales phage TaxID=2100421 RepID=A0A6J5RUQ1_9CAUD|nr:Carbon storage regulator [uncultured Caudovirales phage]